MKARWTRKVHGYRLGERKASGAMECATFYGRISISGVSGLKQIGPKISNYRSINPWLSVVFLKIDSAVTNLITLAICQFHGADEK